jgi:hypothetical protein
MSQDLRWIAPTPPEPEQAVLETHQFTREFYQEVEHRDQFDRYCQWYYATAEQNRREHQKLQNDFNLLGWFCRKS